MGHWGWPEALPKFCLKSGCADALSPGRFFVNLSLTLCFCLFFFLQVRGHLQGCAKNHGAWEGARGAAEFLLGKGMHSIEGVQVNKGESLDNKMPVVSQAHVGRRCPGGPDALGKF
jgi:hypothetical protein